MIALAGLAARVGSFALSDVTFSVPAGGYGVVIGPAGSGKTTLLETIAGIVPARAGTVRLDGVDVTRRAPEERGLSMVYQHAYLFPHLSVDENVGYGATDRRVAQSMTERFGVGALARRSVHSLSGGERQLVALARALATRPTFLLLDEPFAALDPRRRGAVRREVRAVQREWGLTVLQVTHDFAEAGLLGDIAILLDRGRVLQQGAPEFVFRHPASPYVAEFLGAENVFAGEAKAEGGGRRPETGAGADALVEFRAGDLTLHAVGDMAPGAAHAVIRAEEITVAREAHPSSARNHFAGTVVEVVPSGPLARVTVDVHGTPIVAALTTRSVRELSLDPGTPVYVSFKATAVHLC
ncbi:MAG: ATP-binding cassette domain-containing protein [Gemmatimonadaceae bacterium]